jgi:menaquinone-dependent protoporphyrinogen IX oxidase
MKALVAYYSRTGVTRQAAQAVADALQASGAEVAMEEIVDTKPRKGVLGYLAAGRDASLRRRTVISPPAASPSEFDVVVIGSPVWAFTIAPAIRTYCAEHAGEARKAALFCTMGGSGAERAFAQAEKVLGKRAVATLALVRKFVTEGNEQRYLARVLRFAERVAAAG